HQFGPLLDCMGGGLVSQQAYSKQSQAHLCVSVAPLPGVQHSPCNHTRCYQQQVSQDFRCAHNQEPCNIPFCDWVSDPFPRNHMLLRGHWCPCKPNPEEEEDEAFPHHPGSHLGLLHLLATHPNH